MSKIGVIIPFYDDYQHIGRLLTSLTHASRRHQVIAAIGLDVSKRTRSSERVLVTALARHADIDARVLEHSADVPAKVRNDAIRSLLATDPDIDYFFFLDAADLLGDEALDRLVTALDESAAPADFTYQDLIVFGNDRKLVKLDVPFDAYRSIQAPYGTIGSLLRADIFKSGTLLDEVDAARPDRDLLMRRIASTYRGVYCEASDYYRRAEQPPDSGSVPDDAELATLAAEDWSDGRDDAIRSRFEGEDWFDFLAVGDPLEGYFNVPGFDPAKSVRSIFEMRKGALVIGADRTTLDKLLYSRLGPVVQSLLFAAASKGGVLLKVIPGAPQFGYTYDRVPWRDLDPARAFTCAVLSFRMLRDEGPVSVAAQGAADIVVIEIQWPEDLAIDNVRLKGFERLLVRLLAAERGRSTAARARLYGGAGTPAKADLGPVHTMQASTPWKLDGHPSYVAAVQSNAEWNLATRQNSPSYFRETVNRYRPVERTGIRFLIASSFLGVGGVSAGMIDFIKEFRRRHPDAVIDILISHFERSEYGVPQGDNNYKIGEILDDIDGILFGDFIDQEMMGSFLTAALLAYDVVQLETTFPPYDVLRRVRSAERSPKVISHLYCWDYYNRGRVGFPIYVAQCSDLVDTYSSQTALVADYLISRDVHPRKVCHIPYSSRLSFDRQTMVDQRRKRISGPNYPAVIYWSGRWGEQKDPDLLLQVLDLLLDDPSGFDGRFIIHALNEYNNETRFYGEAAARLSELAMAHPDRLSVIWEEVDNRRLTELYTEADILFSTSRWEGIAFVMYEALSAGALVVATDISANTELAAQYAGRVHLSKDRSPDGLAVMLHQAVLDVAGGVALAAFEGSIEPRSFAERQLELIDQLHANRLDEIDSYREDPAVARKRAFTVELDELRSSFESVRLDLDDVVAGIRGRRFAIDEEPWTAELIDQLREMGQRLISLPFAAMAWLHPFFADGMMKPATGRLQGCLDTLQFGADRFRVGGWAFDPQTGVPPAQIVVVTRHRIYGPMAPFVDRSDIGLSAQPVGFWLDEAYSLCDRDDDVLVLAIGADGRVDRVEPWFSVSGGVVRWSGVAMPVAYGGFGWVDDVRSRFAAWPERADNSYHVSGWACDEATGEPAHTIVLADRRGFAVSSPTIIRKDIQDWLGDQAARCGFSIEFKSWSAERPRVFAFFPNHCAELGCADPVEQLETIDEEAAFIERAKPMVPTPTKAAIVTPAKMLTNDPVVASGKGAIKFTFVLSEDAADDNGQSSSPLFTYAKTLADHGQAVEVLLARDMSPHEVDRRRRSIAESGISLLSLADVPDPDIMVYGFRSHYRLSWRIMRWLRQRSASVIVFQDAGGVGFWTVRAKQLGMDFDTRRLVVLATGPLNWRRQVAKTFGDRVVDEDDEAWCERAAIEGADLVVAPGQHMADWLQSEDFRLGGDLIVSPQFLGDPALRETAVRTNPRHLILLDPRDAGGGLALFVAALDRVARHSTLGIDHITLLGSFGSLGSEPFEGVVASLRAKFPSVRIDVVKAFDRANALQFVADTGGVLVIPSTAGSGVITPLAAVAVGLSLIAPLGPVTKEICDETILFRSGDTGLADLIRRIGSIDFEALSHPYDADAARLCWLDAMLGHCRTPPAIVRSRDEETPPPISVCIPFYRHDRYVPRLVRAFLKMELPQLQLVIVDDGTPADERTELDKVRDRLESLGHIVHSQANAGPGAARNKAIELAKYEHLLFFDSDNVPFTSMVRSLWRAMARARADSISSPFAAVPPMTSSPTDADVLYHFHPPGGSLALSLFDNMVGDMTALIRRDALEGVKGFHTRIAEPAWEDWELFFRLSGNDYRHFVYPEPLLYYTDHPNRDKSRERLYDVRSSLIAQLEDIDRPALVRIAKVLAAHSLTLRDRGAW